nr:MAG TPA: hypothetical protein [Caudoviricetes sp.]
MPCRRVRDGDFLNARPGWRPRAQSFHSLEPE